MANRNPVIDRGGRPTVHDWARWDGLLGTMPDTVLARAVGCSSYAVLARRRKLGVRPCRPRNGFDRAGRSNWSRVTGAPGAPRGR